MRTIEAKGLEEQNERHQEEHRLQQQGQEEQFNNMGLACFHKKPFLPARAQVRCALYLAPEVLRGEPATPASDAFGLATLVNEAITQRRPFEGKSMVALPQLVERGVRPEPPAGPLEHEALIDLNRSHLAAASRA